MAVQIVEEDKPFRRIKRSAIKEMVKGVIEQEEKKVGDVSIVFGSDQFLLDINKRFLNRDYLTDVISFDYEEEGQISGDILISVDRVKDNATQFGVSFPEEMRRIIIHGILHLVGYEDDSDNNKANMTARENLYLERYRGDGE